MLTVDEARSKILAALPVPQIRTVPLKDANGRLLAKPLAAKRTQPPTDMSAMDGYAVRADDCAAPPVTLPVIGESAAGKGFIGTLKAGQAVRIFTGASVPEGADAVVIQEDTEREGDQITINEAPTKGKNIRPKGQDFSEGDTPLDEGTRLTGFELALLAAMNHADVPIIRRPRVGLLATGNELVLPGTTPGPDQIIASNAIGLAALIEDWHGIPVDLGIQPDDLTTITMAIERAHELDILVTIGGASVGDHDYVQQALKDAGVSIDFWKVAMKPGKPLMFGTRDKQIVLGLPGNPVSALVTARLFLKPLINGFCGQSTMTEQTSALTLTTDLKANGPRQDYIRATINGDQVTPLSVQDSAQLSAIARADGLIIRPPHADPAHKGDKVQTLLLRA